MSYLIADSGSTKTEWRLQGKDTSKTIFTEGLNPYYHTTQSITEALKLFLIPELEDEKPDYIFFYGAGCDHKGKNKIVFDALQHCFPNASIEIQHDLLAAARACFFDEPGIACILGTGSNSCLYDGQKIIEHIPSLAFVLGDEGSAGYFGKKLINMYFRNELPEALKHELEASQNMSLAHIMKGAYDRAQKSRFIASYGSFLGNHKDHPFIKDMLYEGFHNFITRIVKKYTDADSYEVRFVGSVAQAHEALITEILDEQELKKGLFIKAPLERLVAYHNSR